MIIRLEKCNLIADKPKEAMLDYGTQADILKGNLLGYKGAVFENLMADFLCKSGQKLYYFHKESGLELDFLTRLGGKCVALEVKSKTMSMSTPDAASLPESDSVAQAPAGVAHVPASVSPRLTVLRLA